MHQMSRLARLAAAAALLLAVVAGPQRSFAQDTLKFMSISTTASVNAQPLPVSTRSVRQAWPPGRWA